MPGRTGRILPPAESNLRLAADALRAGQVVGMPTETVYGLAGNALDPEALTRIFSVKERPTFDPLIVHVAPPAGAASVAWLASLGLVDSSRVDALPGSRRQIETLMQRFWPGPLTLVLPKQSRVPDLATSGLDTVAIRMPRHPVAQALIREAGFPLAAPSANRFGRISPTRAEDVEKELGDRIELILDGGPCEIGVESTVLATTPKGLALLRPGGLPREEIESAIGEKLLLPGAATAEGAAQASPGMLLSHYAPRKPLHLLPAPLVGWPGIPSEHLPADGAPIGILSLFGDPRGIADHYARETGRPVEARALSPSGDLAEAARRLFAVLRELDESAASALFAEPCLDARGLGHAIQDRLTRASRR